MTVLYASGAGNLALLGLLAAMADLPFPLQERVGFTLASTGLSIGGAIALLSTLRGLGRFRARKDSLRRILNESMYDASLAPFGHPPEPGARTRREVWPVLSMLLLIWSLTNGLAWWLS